MLAASGTYKYGNCNQTSFIQNILRRPKHTETVRTQTPIGAQLLFMQNEIIKIVVAAQLLLLLFKRCQTINDLFICTQIHRIQMSPDPSKLERQMLSLSVHKHMRNIPNWHLIE